MRLVADSIWTLLHDLRAATDGGDALQGLGFPTRPAATPAGECLIGPDTLAITLADGYLGPATLDRADDGKTWCWHPQASVHVTERLRRQQDESGRIDLEVVLPCRLSEAAVGPPSAWHLETQLRNSAFAVVMREFGPQADGYPSADSAADRYRYRWRSGAGRAPWVDAVISVSASWRRLDVTVWLDITAGPRPGTEDRFRLGLSLQQLEATMVAALQTAADIFPTAIRSDPLTLLNGRPAVRLTVSAPSTPEEIEALAERPRPRQAGSADDQTVTERTVTISGPVIGLSDAEREQYVRDALARLAPGFGYPLS